MQSVFSFHVSFKNWMFIVLKNPKVQKNLSSQIIFIWVISTSWLTAIFNNHFNGSCVGKVGTSNNRQSCFIIQIFLAAVNVWCNYTQNKVWEDPTRKNSQFCGLKKRLWLQKHKWRVLLESKLILSLIWIYIWVN